MNNLSIEDMRVLREILVQRADLLTDCRDNGNYKMTDKDLNELRVCRDVIIILNGPISDPYTNARTMEYISQEGALTMRPEKIY